MAAATAALPAPPQVLLMLGQTVRSRKTTTAHRQQMTSRHVRMLPFGGYPALQNGQLKCRKGKQRLTAGARWEGKRCGATRPGPSLLPSAKQASAWTLACAGCVISKPQATAGCGLACANAVARSSPALDCRGSLRIFRGELEAPRAKVKEKILFRYGGLIRLSPGGGGRCGRERGMGGQDGLRAGADAR